jgi:hypothetical protein
MKTIKDYIAEALILEKFVTLFDDHIDDRMKYSKEIWDMVERAYAYMGGLSGCTTYEEFVKKYVEDEKGKDLMWKCVKRGNKITAVKIYSLTKHGRKSILMASDGTKAGDKDLCMILGEDIKLKDRNAWSEVSGAALGKSLKLGAIPLPAYMLYELLPKKINSGEIKFIDNDMYFYKRLLDGEWHTKMLIGNPIENDGRFEADQELATKLKELGKKYQAEDDKNLEKNKKK